MLRKGTSLLAAAAGALLFGQFPEFFQQYLQRLGGSLDELRDRVVEIQADAAAMGVSVDAYVTSFLESPPHALEGARMEDSLTRLPKLEEAYRLLSEAAPWERGGLLLSHSDAVVAANTFEAFKPALPMTLEGLGYGLAGAGAGLLVAAVAGRSWRRFRRNTRKSRQEA